MHPLIFDDLNYAIDSIPFLTSRTGETEERVITFLKALGRYEELNFLVDLDSEESDLTEEREIHADVLTNKSAEDEPLSLDDDLALAYIKRVTDFDAASIANLLAEETGYLVSIGVTPREAYTDARAWADGIQESQKEEEDAAPVN